MEVMNLQNAVNLLDCILWQYNKAERLQAIIQACQDEFNGNVRDFWNNFYTNIFNIDTANTFGLTVWGILLGVERPTYIDGGVTYPYSDNMYRLFLKSRIMMFQMDGSVYQINKYIQYLFPDKPIYVIDNLDMTMSLNFYYTPSAEEWQVLNNPDFLPRPSGVMLEVKAIDPANIFGFNGTGFQPWDTKPFRA